MYVYKYAYMCLFIVFVHRDIYLRILCAQLHKLYMRADLCVDGRAEVWNARESAGAAWRRRLHLPRRRCTTPRQQSCARMWAVVV